MPPLAQPRSRVTAGLGTFSGVFTPSVLTILGIILFRRLGYVVGSAGLGQPFSEQLASLPIVAMVAAHGDVQLRIEDETAIDGSSPIAATSPDKS